MARTISFEGRNISVPDDASDDEVAQILGQQSPAAQSQPAAQAPEQEQSFLDRVIADLKGLPGNTARAVGGALDTAAAGASNLLVGGPVGGLAGLGARATGNDPAKAHEWVDKNLVYHPQTQVGMAAGNAFQQGMRPVGQVVGAVDSAIGKVSPTAQSVVRSAVGTASDMAGAAPLAGAASAGYTAIKNIPESQALAKASRIANQAAGPNVDAIRAANSAAPANVTAGQAAAGVNQDTWQALAELARRNDKDSFYRKLADDQQAARAARLEGVTPDLALAMNNRSNASTPFYGAAMEQSAPVTGQLADALNRMPSGVMRSAEELARVSGSPFEYTRPNAMFGGGIADAPPQVSGSSLHFMKKAIDEHAKDAISPTAESTSRMMGQSALALKPTFLKAFEDAIPAYKTGRQVFAQESPPVNQANILQELAKALDNPLQGERAGRFMDVVSNPGSIMKKATGETRFGPGDLPKVLTGEQMAAVDDVASQLRRDAAIGKQADAGSQALTAIVDENKSKFRIPSRMTMETAATNKGLDYLEGKLNKRVLDKLVQGMKDGKSANELLAGLSTKDKAIVEPFLKVPPKAMAASGAAGIASALTDQEKR